MPVMPQPSASASPSVPGAVPGAWSESALRDTIAEIARQSEYQRELTTSLAARALRWLGDLLDALFTSVRGAPYGREITIAVVGLLVALVVARIVIGVRAERALVAARVPRKATVADLTALADAERLAQAGEFTAAAHALFAALLRACAARGEIRLHPSKTTGDYARELRRRSMPSLRPFQSFRSRYDRVIYGDMQCSADDYAALATDARQLLGRERAA